MARPLKKIKVKEKKLGREGAVGLAYASEMEIVIDKRQGSKDYLDTLIHEMLHCFAPHWGEKRVNDTANEMTRVIWDKDYRRIEKQIMPNNEHTFVTKDLPPNPNAEEVKKVKGKKGKKKSKQVARI